MSQLEAARKCRDLFLRREAQAKTLADKQSAKIKLDEIRKHISYLHRQAKEVA